MNEAIHHDALSLIGNTPIVELTQLGTGPCRLFAKMELMNPGGSIKDRVALAMVEGAERDGRLAPGGTIVEATSGNTGVGLALIAVIKGYRLIIVIPDKMSQEKIQHLRACGAEVIVTRSDVEPGHPLHYTDLAADIAERTEGAVYIRQHGNPDNPRAHEEGTGPEIWSQMEGDVDAIVFGVGTGGTLTGLGKFFETVDRKPEIVMADPVGSILADYVRTGELTEAGAWLVEGIGEDEIPPIADMSYVDSAITVSDKESFDAARMLVQREGILGGSSTGTAIAAALRYCEMQVEPKRVVVMIPDRGDKYLSKMYNDYWMADQGFIRRSPEGNLCDLIARPHGEGEDVVVSPEDSLLTAYGRMKLYNVSQLPVMARDDVVGVLDEQDLLFAVYGDRSGFEKPVRTAMSARLKTLACDAPLDDLVSLLKEGYVALIVQGSTYRGLVTRVDLLNFLRRRSR